MKQRCQHERVSLGIHHLNDAPPETVMPTKKNDYPTGLRQRRGSGSWFQVFNDKHRKPAQKWVKLKASTRSRAEIERGRLIADYESGAFDPWKVGLEAEVVSLQEAYAGFLETKSGLAPNSITSKKQAIGHFLESIPTKTRPDQVEPKDFRRHFDRSGLKPSSKKTYLAELCHFFEWCQDQGYAPTNPARVYKKNQVKSQSRFEKNREKREGARRGAIMPTAFRKLVGHISTQAAMANGPMQARHDLMRDVVTFAVATGLRRSELAHLRRTDVHLGPVAGRWPDTGIIDVQCWDDPATGAQFVTKSGLDRMVRLVPAAAQIAARHLATGATENDNAPLFCTSGGRRLGGSSLAKWFLSYRVDSGLPEGTTFHSLRHSFASYLLMLGVDVLLIQEYMGHSSLSMMEHYAKAAKRYLTGDARKLMREILTLLCPDLSPGTVEELLPGREAFSKTINARGLRRRRRSSFAIEDVLFDGAAYEADEELLRRARPAEIGRFLHGNSDLIKTQ